MDYINRAISSNSYQNSSGFLFPLICDEDLTDIVGKCSTTNKRITDISVEVTMLDTPHQILTFPLSLYYYNPTGFIKILKSDPQEFRPAAGSGANVAATAFSQVCALGQCNPSNPGFSGTYCNGTQQLDYIRYIGIYSCDITVVAISCGSESGGNFSIYLLVDNFIDINGNKMDGQAWITWVNSSTLALGNIWATLTITCPSIQNGNYVYSWSPVGVGFTIDTCPGIVPLVTNITVEQQ